MNVKLNHHDDKAKLDKLFPAVREYQKLAAKHGIYDIFQDNGGKLLQTLLILNMTCMKSREGNDATDADGNEYELKTANAKLVKAFTTHHHLNEKILAKYRAVKAWYFSFYEGIELTAIFRLYPTELESFFVECERKIQKRVDEGKEAHLNNPKVTFKFVLAHGTLVFSDPADGHLNLSKPTANPLK